MLEVETLETLESIISIGGGSSSSIVLNGKSHEEDLKEVGRE